MGAAETAARACWSASAARARAASAPQEPALAPPLPPGVPALPRPLPVRQEYLTWNEANHRGQPTWNHPKIVGRYHDILRHNCRGCTITGPSVLDTTKMPGWVKRVESAAKHRIGVWALHNYIDANRFRTRGTRSLLKATKARIWFTETGGLVRRDNGSRIEFAESPRHAVKATRG